MDLVVSVHLKHFNPRNRYEFTSDKDAWLFNVIYLKPILGVGKIL